MICIDGVIVWVWVVVVGGAGTVSHSGGRVDFTLVTLPPVDTALKPV